MAYSRLLVAPEFRPTRVFGQSITYSLKDLPKVEVTTPEIHWVLRFTGEITLKTKGELPVVDVSADGISLQAQHKASTELADLIMSGSFKVEEGKRAEVNCGLNLASKAGGQVFATQTVTPIPPSTIRYTYKPSEVKGETKQFEISGSFGYELDVTKLDRPRPGQPAYAFSPRVNDSTVQTFEVVASAVFLARIAAAISDIVLFALVF